MTFFVVSGFMVKHRRVSIRMAKSELAVAANLSMSHIGLIERTSSITLREATAERLCRALGVTMRDIAIGTRGRAKDGDLVELTASQKKQPFENPELRKPPPVLSVGEAVALPPAAPPGYSPMPAAAFQPTVMSSPLISVALPSPPPPAGGKADLEMAVRIIVTLQNLTAAQARVLVEMVEQFADANKSTRG